MINDDDVITLVCDKLTLSYNANTGEFSEVLNTCTEEDKDDEEKLKSYFKEVINLILLLI